MKGWATQMATTFKLQIETHNADGALRTPDFVAHALVLAAEKVRTEGFGTACADGFTTQNIMSMGEIVGTYAVKAVSRG